MSPLTALAATLLLAACGALESPIAPVAGRIVGAADGAYAYPLGRPDLKVAASTADGSFRLGAVPATVEALVLFDGTDRAELVPVRIDGGDLVRIGDRFGRDAIVDDALKMPLAGAVVAAALPDGGAVPTEASFSVLETDHEGLPPDAGEEETVTLYPLPAGSFQVAAIAAGFRERRVTVQVAAGATVPAQLLLDIDLDDDAPGCASSDGCEHGLHCSGADGRCYACTADEDCDADERCSVAVGLCMPLTGAASAICSACDDDAGCTSGACVSGYCTVTCAGGCPAGFACDGNGRCAAPSGCDDWLQTMGSTCLDDDACDDLAGGRCERSGDSPGFCTAPCAADADCRVGSSTAAWVCASGPLGLHCAPP